MCINIKSNFKSYAQIPNYKSFSQKLSPKYSDPAQIICINIKTNLKSCPITTKAQTHIQNKKFALSLKKNYPKKNWTLLLKKKVPFYYFS